MNKIWKRIEIDEDLLVLYFAEVEIMSFTTITGGGEKDTYSVVTTKTGKC